MPQVPAQPRQAKSQHIDKYDRKYYGAICIQPPPLESLDDHM